MCKNTQLNKARQIKHVKPASQTCKQTGALLLPLLSPFLNVIIIMIGQRLESGQPIPHFHNVNQKEACLIASAIICQSC